MKPASKANSASIKCEQSTNEGNGLDVWLGRIAMVGFAVAITVEVSTGKGLLEVQSASFHHISFTRNEWLILTYIFFWHLITPFFSIPNTTFSAYYTMSFFHHLNNIEFGNQVVTVLIGCHNGFFIFPCHTSYDRVGPLIPLCTLT